MATKEPTKPSDVTDDRGWFDHLADRVSTMAASSWFFVGLIVLTLAWVALGPLADFSHRWVDTLQVVGTVLTLLLVVVLENEQWRNAKATHRKLNALAAALAHLMAADHTASEHIEQLEAAVGVEKRESVSDSGNSRDRED
ncbi:MAG TPA: low affinity iron permease family protein [Acidimicrobiales bacterium]|nr:low affinity iron permease family protein [Acidimicrobiales bacterium]